MSETTSLTVTITQRPGILLGGPEVAAAFSGLVETAAEAELLGKLAAERFTAFCQGFTDALPDPGDPTG